MTLHDHIVAALRKVYDPEMPVNIYELGLIYDIAVDDAGRAAIRMTLTAPNCPVAGTLPAEVERYPSEPHDLAPVHLRSLAPQGRLKYRDGDRASWT